MLTRCNGFAIIKRAPGHFLLIQPHGGGGETMHHEATLFDAVTRAQALRNPAKPFVGSPAF